MAIIGTRVYDKLLAGNQQVRTDGCTVVAGADLSRGAVLGRISAGTVPTTGTATSGNTGNGTVTAVTGGRATRPGDYTLVCVSAGTGTGAFQVLNPNGETLGIAIIGTAFTSAELNLLVGNGATDFAIGDSFTVTVPESDNKGKLTLVNSAAVDGSGVPVGVLLEDVAAAEADVVAQYATSGQFNAAALTFGGSDTAEDYEEALKAQDIHLKFTNIPE